MHELRLLHRDLFAKFIRKAADGLESALEKPVLQSQWLVTPSEALNISQVSGWQQRHASALLKLLSQSSNPA